MEEKFPLHEFLSRIYSGACHFRPRFSPYIVITATKSSLSVFLIVILKKLLPVLIKFIFIAFYLISITLVIYKFGYRFNISGKCNMIPLHY